MQSTTKDFEVLPEGGSSTVVGATAEIWQTTLGWDVQLIWFGS
jgi:hypothetical protein